MPFPWISLKRATQTQTQTTRSRSPPPGLTLSHTLQQSSFRTSTNYATSPTASSVSYDMPPTRGTAAVHNWLDGVGPDTLATAQADAADQTIRGPQTQGQEEVLRWLASPGPETLCKFLSARDMARVETLARSPTPLERPSPALPVLQFEPLCSMLAGTELEIPSCAELVSVPDAEADAVTDGSSIERPRILGNPKEQTSSSRPRKKRVGISHLYPELWGNPPESLESATGSRMRIADLYREPVYDFCDGGSEEEDDDDLFMNTARDIEDLCDGYGDKDLGSHRHNAFDGTVANDDSDDEQVLPLAYAVVQHAHVVEITRHVPRRIPRLVRQDATLGRELPVTVGRVGRGRVVDVERRKVVPESDSEEESENDERKDSRDDGQDASRGRGMSRGGSWRPDEEEPLEALSKGLSEVSITATPATPPQESMWDSSSDEEDHGSCDWIEDVVSAQAEDDDDGNALEVGRTTRPKQLTITLPLRPSHHGRSLEVPIRSYGPSRSPTTLSSPSPPASPRFDSQSTLREDSIALLLQTLSLPPSSSFTTLQSHLASNTSLLHALLLGTVPAPFLPQTEMNELQMHMDIRTPPERYVSSSVPALTAFLSIDWDPAPLGGGSLCLLASAFREAINRASVGPGRIALVNCAAYLRKTSRASMRASGRLADGMLVRLGRVVGLEEVVGCADLGTVIRAGRVEEFVGLVEAGGVTRGEQGEMGRKGAIVKLMGIQEHEGVKAKVERKRREGLKPSPLRIVELVDEE